MITLEELSTLVFKEFADDEIALESWSKIQGEMQPHYEEVPCSDWYKDEYGNEV